MNEIPPSMFPSELLNDETHLYEPSVIGAIAIDSTCLKDVIPILQPEDFNSVWCRKAYEIAKKSYEEHSPFDVVILANAMTKEMGVDAGHWVMECMQVTPTCANVVVHSKLLKKASQSRALRENLLSTLYQNDDPDEISKKCVDICRDYLSTGNSSRLKPIAEVMNKFYTLRTQQQSRVRIDTGYSRLDRILKGMWGGQLIVIGARPGVGKSAFSMEIALSGARAGHKTAIYSLEMEGEEIGERLVSRVGNVDMDDLINLGPETTDEELWEKVSKSCADVSNLPIWVCDDPKTTMSSIAKEARTIEGLEALIIDYLGLISTEKAAKGRNNENRTQEIAKITREAKLLTKELHIPVILLSQLNRDKDENERPRLKDLRDSGAIEQDADKVIFLWDTGAADEDDEDAPKEIGVSVAKNRRGKRGDVLFLFYGEHMEFAETTDAPPRTGAYSSSPKKSRKKAIYDDD